MRCTQIIHYRNCFEKAVGLWIDTGGLMSSINDSAGNLVGCGSVSCVLVRQFYVHGTSKLC